jgi:hypothetical protein
VLVNKEVLQQYTIATNITILCKILRSVSHLYLTMKNRFYREINLVLVKSVYRIKLTLYICMVEPSILRLIDCLLPTNALNVNFI